MQAHEEQVVVFRLAEEWYGLDIGVVQEIIAWQPVTRVPRAPADVEGIINLRGHIIPVVDLRRRFGLEPAAPGREARIVVAELGERVVGLRVDGVSEVLRVPAGAIEPPTTAMAGIDSDFIRGVAKTEDRLIILLNPQRLLGDGGQPEGSPEAVIPGEFGAPAQ